MRALTPTLVLALLTLPAGAGALDLKGAEEAVAGLLAPVDAALCDAARATLVTGCLAWSRRADRGASDHGRAVAASPGVVFVTGESWGGRTGYDYLTTAFDALTGERLWAASYAGAANANDYPRAIAVTPDGRTVLVTGESNRAGMGNADYATVAYDALTGELRWVDRYAGPGNWNDVAYGIALDASGTVAVVTGWSFGGGTDFDAATVAYDVATGERKWVARYNCPHNGANGARAVAVAGGRAFVAGHMAGGMAMGGTDLDLLAYDLATGELAWNASFDGTGGWNDQATALATSPDGRTVVAAGLTYSLGSGFDMLALAHDAETGERRWAVAHDGSAGGHDLASALAVTPDRVVLAGRSPGATTGLDQAVVALDLATGRRLWESRLDGPASGHDAATAVALTPDGLRVLVVGEAALAGTDRDVTVTAHALGTGARLWSLRHGEQAGAAETAAAAALTPEGTRLVVAASGRGAGHDGLALAFALGPGVGAPAP